MGRFINQKNKSKVIRAFRTPSAPVVMSLMALILIIGAPALVSVIDDSMSSDIMVKNASFEGDGAVITYRDADGWRSNLSVLMPSDNDGAYFYTNTVPEEASSVRQVAILDSGHGTLIFDKMIVTISGDMPDTVKFAIGSSSDALSFPKVDMITEQIEPGVFVLYSSSIQRAQMSSDGYDSWSISLMYGSGLTTGSEVTVETYTASTIAYGEIIVGATGVLLIVCAILATPWVGTTGLTIKRRR